MNKNRRNLLIIIIVGLIAILGMFTYLQRSSGFGPNSEMAGESAAVTDNSLVITNLDVGKADSALIQCEGTVGVIDVGTEEAFNTIDAFLKEKGITKIDYLILTHFDQDHIGSAMKIIDNYEIGALYIPDYVSSKRYYEGLMAAAGTLENVNVINSMTVFNLGNLRIEIVPADNPDVLIADADNVDNNMSLLTKLIYGSKTFLFTGDVEKDRITQMLESNYALNADWIKLPHHDDFTKKVEQLLEVVSPEYAVSSTGVEQPVEEDMITYMADNGIEHYITYNGNVVTVCDGESITCSQ